jgi:HK97 family phage portal protein
VDKIDEEVGNLIELRDGYSRIFEEIKESRRTVSGVNISPETSLQCAAVLACVRVLAESLASLPMNVYRRLPGGGKEIADEQYLHEVLCHQPNSWMTSFEFRELMQSWLLLWGNAYAFIKGGRQGGVSELIPLHPSRMEVKRLTNGKLRYYYTEPTTPIQPQVHVTEYRQDEIFHLRWLSSDGVTGFVPTALSRDAIGLARATELHSGAFFGHGAMPGTYIETDQPHKPEVLARFKEQWNDAHAGPNNAYKTVVMPFGFHRKQIEQRNDTAMLVETRRYQCEEVARVYRVPGHLIGDLSNVRFSTVEQSAIDFVTFSLIPWCRRWESACRRDLVVDDKQYFVQFDTNALMAGDYAARSQFIREMANLGALDVDEIRAQIGYNPLPDGLGKKRFVQVNMQLLDAFTVENPNGQKPQPEGDPAQADQEPTKNQPETDQEPTKTTDQTDQEPTNDARAIAGAEVVFKTTLRRLAGVEADGVLERRNKPEKMAAWLDTIAARIREELRESAQATGRDIDQFASNWAARSRELLLECHRSGQKYEIATEGWCDKHL